MGTNFYCKEINKKKRKKFSDDLNDLSNYISHHVDNPEIDLKKKVAEFLDDNEEFEKQIHLGKRSAGWQFLWDYHNGLYFQPNLKSIKKFLSQKNIVIYDEYGKYFTVDQFFNQEIAYSLYKRDNLDDGMRGPYSSHYFIADKLRFSKFEDFS